MVTIGAPASDVTQQVGGGASPDLAETLTPGRPQLDHRALVGVGVGDGARARCGEELQPLVRPLPPTRLAGVTVVPRVR
jgi:hypothetical protein